MYPKRYGTIICRREDGTLDVRLDEGGVVQTHVRARCGGRTPTASLRRGVRVKLYERGGKWNFRRVGR